MNYKLSQIKEFKPQKCIQVSGSKSESNRLLVLQAHFPELRIENLSTSDDTQIMLDALSTTSRNIDVGHAGTAMRFLTAYFATKENAFVTLTGSERMKQRPIKILVDALKELGAVISYKEKEGFPPLEIEGKKLAGGEVTLNAGVSSQYISALMLVGASLKNGLKLHLRGKITSIPYIKMTESLLNEAGILSAFKNQTITVQPQKKIISKTVVVESDWSSASYFYSIVALAPAASLKLKSYNKNSIQGDSALSTIYKELGVETSFGDDGSITLTNTSSKLAISTHRLQLDLIETPDIAQTIAVSCFGLGMGCDIEGLHTLKIKETDRLVALQNELQKLGASVKITNESIHIEPSKEINDNCVIETYHDHRMAMSFAPLAMKTSLAIKDPNVVSKSFPKFWEVLQTVGFEVQ